VNTPRLEEGGIKPTILPPTNRRSAGVRRLIREYPILFIAISVWAVLAAATPNFATADNIAIILSASAVILVAATGQTLVLLTGGIDASVATVAACSAVLAAAVMGREGSPLVGLAVALLVGGAFGLANAVAVAALRLTPLVFTLGTMLVARGIAFSVSQGVAMRVPRELRDFRRMELFDFPAIVIVALLVLVIFGLLLSQTSWGRHVYLLGNNEQSARYVGIRHRLVKASVYLISGLLGGLAGYLSIINLGVAIPGVGDTILLTIIGGVIVGGTSLFGGEGSIWRTVIGVLLLASLGNGLNLLGFQFYDQLVVEGIVILIGATLAVRLSQST
jgi:ribose transport system permease protein